MGLGPGIVYIRGLVSIVLVCYFKFLILPRPFKCECYGFSMATLIVLFLKFLNTPCDFWIQACIFRCTRVSVQVPHPYIIIKRFGHEFESCHLLLFDNLHKKEGLNFFFYIYFNIAQQLSLYNQQLTIIVDQEIAVQICMGFKCKSHLTKKGIQHLLNSDI